MNEGDVRSLELAEHELGPLARTLAIGQVAPGVIHEINNPLFAILGILEFLLADAEPGTKTYERLQLLQQSGLEIKDIVRTLMDFSREHPDERHALGLDELAAEAMQLFHRTSVSRDIELALELGQGPFVVHANPNALKVALLNLLTYAARSMPHGGTARVHVARAGEAVTASVSPAGDPGGGLDLAIARALAEQHGGELTREPSDGSPARYVLRLPAAS
jgi:two-component system sensor histidine kinase HydH